MLLHAFPLNQVMWEGQIEALSKVAHVISLDLPGFGASQTVDGDYSLDTLAEVVHDFLRKLGHERVVLGGLSMGGYIALAYARKYPQHLQGLVLADTKASPDTPEARENRLKQVAEIDAHGLRALSTSFPRKILTAQSALNKPAMLRELEGLIAGNSVSAVRGALLAMADRPDSFDVLPGVHVPALVLVGDADETTTYADAQAMVDALPPRSGVRGPAFSVCSMAARMASCAAR